MNEETKAFEAYFKNMDKLLNWDNPNIKTDEEMEVFYNKTEDEEE